MVLDSPSRVAGKKVKQNHRDVRQDCNDDRRADYLGRDTENGKSILVVYLRKNLDESLSRVFPGVAVQTVQNLGGVNVYTDDTQAGLFFWKSPISIDGDGSNGRTSLPCYAPPGYGKTLDWLANAGSWENWYGIATNSHGMPYVQGADDPAEGAYVSTTSLQDVSKDIDDPDRYVDSAGVPYLVLPENFSLGQQLSDLAFAWNILTGDSTNLVHADVGDRNHLSEISVKAAQNLNLPSSPKTGGCSDARIAFIYWRNSRIGWPRSNQDILDVAYDRLQQFGGMKKLLELIPQS